ncbi:hypothetical protein NDU88_004625 [Pleurodeles waltl]|uniref:Uncharacterized protein n=1 Tax=Pleurodeles waltl TaxID=8319 RepID=A0AAV7MUF4_PLEWA|nr:hypothetical protein NDU88_004625 [Pleurodeles waltl]
MVNNRRAVTVALSGRGNQLLLLRVNGDRKREIGIADAPLLGVGDWGLTTSHKAPCNRRRRRGSVVAQSQCIKDSPVHHSTGRAVAWNLEADYKSQVTLN